MARLVLVAALATVTCYGGMAFAQTNPCKVGGDAARDTPSGRQNFQYSANDVEVVVHRGLHETTAPRGFTNVDDPVIFHCVSASGCLLIAHPQIVADIAGYLTCTYVGDKPMDGKWTVMGNAPDFSDTIIPTGDNTVRTKVWAYNDGVLHGWAITYTMYDQRTGAQIRTPLRTN